MFNQDVELHNAYQLVEVHTQEVKICEQNKRVWVRKRSSFSCNPGGRYQSPAGGAIAICLQ